MVNASNTGARPKGITSSTTNSSTIINGLGAVFVSSSSCYPPDSFKVIRMNNITTAGYVSAKAISEFNTVQASSEDINSVGNINNTDVTVPTINIKLIHKYINELTSVIFGRDDEITALDRLTPVFNSNLLSELQHIYERHRSYPQNIVYFKSELTPFTYLILKEVFQFNNLSNYIINNSNYITVCSAYPPRGMLMTDSEVSEFHLNSGLSGSDEDGGGDGYGPIQINGIEEDEREDREEKHQRIQHHTVTDVDILKNNNIKFTVQVIGYGKEFISTASGYPPYLDPNKLITVESVSAQGQSTDELGNYVQYINEDDDILTQESIISNTQTLINNIDDNNTEYIISALSEYEFTDDILNTEDDSHLIVNKQIKWWITVPVQLPNGNQVKIRMMADTGANAGCVDAAWAWKYFKQIIRRNTRNNTLKVPGGRIHPKYVLYFVFPTIKGPPLKARMFLVDNLPVNVIAGLNMLYAFGYKFSDDIPTVFRHTEEEDLDLELTSQDDIYKVHAPVSDDNQAVTSYQDYIVRKDKQLIAEGNTDVATINYINDVGVCDEISVPGQIIYDYSVGSHIKVDLNPTNQGIPDQSDFIEEMKQQLNDTPATVQDILSTDVSSIELVPLTINKDEMYSITDVSDHDAINPINARDAQTMINTTHVQINSMVHSTRDKQVSTNNNHFGLTRTNKRHSRQFGKIGNTSINIFHTNANTLDVNFIMAKQSYLADDKEIREALNMNYNKILEHNDVSYLKDYAKHWGGRFEGLYEAYQKLLKSYKDIWAKHTYDRRTMKVPPVRLGIMDKYRHIQCYVPQYPMTPLKRKWMIVYTHENEENGYWSKVQSALHCIPYTMVAKKNKDGLILRYRPAFDARIVNQYCELFKANMPTMKDFDEFHSIKGLFTMADLKNMFDNIPLHEDDQPWATVLTPLGLFRMQHLAYGWKNAATNAQAIMNKMSVYVGFCLAYIDDILLKHPWHWGTKELIAHLERFFKYIRDKNMLLNPTKFFPFCMECINFSIKRTLQGSSISDAYKNKILTFAEPTTAKELAEFIGIIGYVDRYIYNCAKFKYWLNLLLIEAKNHKRGKLTLSKNGKIAFYQLLWLVKNSPILHNPTRDGIFCVKTDACNYGTGAVLYQQQTDQQSGKKRWVIIDMFSKVMPQQMRHSHSMVHEALAIVQALQHWQFHLIKREFIIATDNKPIASLFVPRFRDLDTITQKQLLRLRIAIAQFTYQIRHVEGLKNEIADGLSRFSMELYQELGLSRTVDPLDSTDTGNKELTDEDRRILEELVLKNPNQMSEKDRSILDAIEDTKLIVDSKLLRLKMKEESQNNNFNSIHTLLKLDTKQGRYKTIEHEQTAEFKQLLHHYRINSTYDERDRITDYVNSITDDTTLISDEFAFNSDPINSFMDGMNDICNICHKLSDTTRCELAELTTLASEEIELDYCNASDLFETDSKTDVTDILPSGHKVVTRSQTRILRESGNQTINQHDYITHGYNKVLNAMQTREEIMSDLFGHRGLPSELFTIPFIKSAQADDNVLKLILYLLRHKHQTPNIRRVQQLRKLSPYYYFKYKNNQLRIGNSGILEASEYVNVQKKDQWLIVIPFLLRGQYLDYAHHNQNLQHLHWTYSYDWLSTRYYWPRMKQDIQYFCEKCKVCKFSKGSIRHKAPMQIRQLPKPREHIMCDFIGPIFKNYGKYYILAIIDYATGYTMLLPVEGCDAQTVIDALMQHWIPIFGVMATIETDYGSGFDNHLYRMLMHALGVKWEYAERNNHRSIGKVERIIGFVQSILKRYNIQLDQRITNPTDADYEESWDVLKIIIPHIQAAINQRRPRFTTYSPNMLMFGSQLHDASDISRILHRMKQAQQYSNIKDDEHKYLVDLITRLTDIYRNFNDDYKKYTYFTKERYDAKWRTRNSRKFKQYQEGKYVLYYVGDKQIAQHKWLSQWSGPWKITKKLNDGTRIITDEETGNQIRVSIDRLKLFHNQQPYLTYDDLSKDPDYGIYERKLKDILYQHNVKTRTSNVNLDYRTNNSDANNL